MLKTKTLQAHKDKIIGEFTEILNKIMHNREIVKEDLDFFTEFESIIKPFVKQERYNSFEISTKKQELQYKITTYMIIAKYSKNDKLVIEYNHNVIFLTDEFINEDDSPLLKKITETELPSTDVPPILGPVTPSPITVAVVENNANECFTSDQTSIAPAFNSSKPGRKPHAKKW